MKKLLDNKWIQFILAVSATIFIYKCFNNLGDITNSLKYLWDVFFPCVLGLIFALFLYKPVSYVQKLYQKNKHTNKISLHLSIASVIVILVIFVAVLITFIVPPIYKNLEDLANQLPSYYKAAGDFLNNNQYTKGLVRSELFSEILPKIINVSNLTKYINLIADVANWFLTIFISLVLSVYILFEKEHILSFLRMVRRKFFTSHHSAIVISYIKKTISLFYSYFTGLFIDAAIIGTFSAIIFSIFNVPYPFVLGLIVGVGNLIPFLGPIAASVIVFVITAIALGPLNAVWILILQFVLGQIDSNFIQPKILSQSTGISPLLVLVSVSVFGSLWGAGGMIIGVPVCALIKTLIMDYVEDGVIDGQPNKEK